MTTEQAIEILPCIGKPEHIYSLQECKAIQIAIEALVKQIQQKPVFTHGNHNNDWECPKCGRRYGNYGYYDYCPKCGQKILWEVVEE